MRQTSDHRQDHDTPQPPDAAAIAAMADDPRIAAVRNADHPLDELHRLVQMELAKEDVPTAACMAWWGEMALGNQ